jgi:hypothetical protein
MRSLKIVNGVGLIAVWALIAIVALTVMITFYCGRCSYEAFILGKSKMSRLFFNKRTSRGNKHQRGSPFL